MIRVEAKGATVLALPEHLLAAVFAAAGASELASCRLTCKGFVAPANEAVRQLKLRRLSAVSLANFPCVRVLDASEVTDWGESWLAELVQVPQLESLKLGRQQPLTFVGAETLAQLGGRLQRLDLTASTLPDSALHQLSALHSLRSIALRECCHLTDAGLAVLASFRQLREADLSMCWQLSNATLERLSAGCPHLNKLDLTGCERFSEAGLRHLARLPLRSLLLSACFQLTDGCLQAIGEGMPQLSCLGLFESGEAVTDAGLAHLARLRGSLTGLDLGYSCWAHTSAGLKALLEQLPGLQMLNIGGCEGTTDTVVAAVAQHCHQLTMLDVSESQRMTAAGVRQLGQLPCLLELNLGWNIRLKDEALECLPRSLTKLDLSFCGELTDLALAHMAALPALASCTLRKCSRIGDDGVRQLARCTTLEALDLSYSALVTSAGLADGLRPLRRLATLALVDCTRAVHAPCIKLLRELPVSKLDLSDNKRLDDGCVQALSHATNLRSLTLNSCQKVTDRGLLALSRSRLRHLSVDRCPQLSAIALERLQRRLPLLRLGRPAGSPRAAAPIAEY